MESDATANTASSTKVFTVTELVRLIVCHLELADITRLSQICRRTFRILAPVVWQNVDGAQHLLGLIKSTTLQYVYQSSKSYFRIGDSHRRLKRVVCPHLAYSHSLADSIQISLSYEKVIKSNSDPNPLERFNLYAPFVETLKVYSKKRNYYQVSGWPVLVEHINSRTLLPNLKNLSIAATDDRVALSDIPKWIVTFAGPSLVDLSWCIENYYWPDEIWALTHTATTEIMRHVVARAPNLQQITLAPHHPSDPLGNDRLLFEHYRSSKIWYEYFQGLSSIRHLSITSGWLSRSSIVALSKLLTLESLELYVDEFTRFHVDYDIDSDFNITSGPPIDSDLPNDPFPALRRLTISRMEHEIYLGDHNLFPQLKELNFFLKKVDTDGEWEPRSPAELVEPSIFPSLTNAPRLKTLYVDFTDGGRAHVIENLDSLSVMMRLPLEKIEIPGISLGKSPFKVDLGAIWPNVTVLILPGQSASLQELAYFAAMPALVRLVVRLRLTDIVTPTNIPLANHSPMYTLGGAGGRLAQTPEGIQHQARVLKLLWPNLQDVDSWGFWGANLTAALILNRLLSDRIVGAPALPSKNPESGPSLPALYERLRQYGKQGAAYDSDSSNDSDGSDDSDGGNAKNVMKKDHPAHDSHGTKCDRLGPLHASTGDTTITGAPESDPGAPSTQNTPPFLLSLASSCGNRTWHGLQPRTTQHMSQASEGSRPQFLYTTNSGPTFVPAPVSIPPANAVSDGLANAKPSRAIDWNHVRDYAALIIWPPEDTENDDVFDPEGTMPVVRLSISVLNTPSDSLFRELHKFFESFLPRYFYDYAMFDDTLMIRIRRRFEVSDSIKRGMLGTAILFRSNYERSVLAASLRSYAKELHVLAMNSLKLELDSTRIPIQAKLASMMELTNHEYYAGNLVTYYHHLNQAASLIRIIMGGRTINLLTLSGEQTFDIRWFCWGDILSSMALSRPTLLDYEFDVQYPAQLHNVKNQEYVDPDKGIEWIFGCPDILAVLLARTTALRHAHLSVKEKVSEGSKIEQLIRNCQFAPVRAKQSTLRVARLGAQEVWRQIAILYTHEAIFQSKPSNPAVKDSVKNIVRIASTLRPGYNPDCFLAVPYFIAGFFATSEKDRFFLRNRILTCGNEHYLRNLAASLDDLWHETDTTPGGLASWARKQPPRFMF